MNKGIQVFRYALFIVYFWFGMLKVLGKSPANSLVLALLHKTLPSVDPTSFLLVFGLFEVLIALLFLAPKFEQLALVLLTIHIVMICLPLLLVPEMTWKAPLVPTLEGQYIIKNILIIYIAYNLARQRKMNKL